MAQVFHPIRLMAGLGLSVVLSCSGGGGSGGGSTYSAPPPPSASNLIRVGVASGGYGMAENVFSPDILTVKAGDTVTWRWEAAGHTVDSGDACTPDGKFSSNGIRSTGFTLTHTFPQPGTYPYYCLTHCGTPMVGKVIVQ